MKCRYCGDNLRSINQKLFSSLGERCLGNPAGVHVCITDGINCVFCGNKTRFQNGKPSVGRWYGNPTFGGQ